MTWLTRLFALVALWWANRQGRSAGQATQRQADVAAAQQERIKVDEAVSHADAAAPRVGSDLADRVLRGDSNL